ncbi:hypothetical protein OZ691_004241 [Yersinia enterocolitica]|uniref:YobI family P-loop NTPase n=1 Tax=Yersinia enterocolitica TaxID=630 RepID=UPI003CFEF86F
MMSGETGATSVEDKQNIHSTESRDDIISSPGYEALTPGLIDDDTTEQYFRALDFAWSRDDIKNLAITGPYGSGKSTVIQSYLILKKEEEYINVSLADFGISNSEASPTPKDVELSILQQMLYKKDKRTLPDSRIDRIQNRDRKHVIGVFLTSLSVLLPALLLLALTLTDRAAELLFLPAGWSAFFKNHYIWRATGLAVLMMLTLYALTRVASSAGIFDKKIRLSKIAFLSGDTEATTQESTSLLNNCLDEIVYFFSRSGYRTVVFEDLDRLNNTHIFIKLREINQIINNHAGCKSPVRFVYAVRDDIFLGADIRTKFFDFILPVIPVLDSRNAHNILEKKLPGFPLKDKPCLRGTSLYINDMRSLQNIINEYILFMDVVDNSHSQARLYALIFYKNLYAQDYNLIDRKLGILYSFVRDYRSKDLHKNYFGTLELQVQTLKEKLKRLRDESQSTPKHVREEIISRFISRWLWGSNSFRVINRQYHSNNTYDSATLCSDENLFLSVFNGKNEIFVGPTSQSFYPLEADVIKQLEEEYRARIRDLDLNREESMQATLAALEKACEEVRQHKAMSLAELTRILGREQFEHIARGYVDLIQDEEVLSSDQRKALLSGLQYGGLDALFYLLSNGYLAQDFMMYRSIFIEGTLTASDNEYVKQVAIFMSSDEANQNWQLDNVKEVVTELNAQAYLFREGAWHYQVIGWLIQHEPELAVEAVTVMLHRTNEQVFRQLILLSDGFAVPTDFDQFIRFTTEKCGYSDRLIDVLYNATSGLERSHILVSVMTNTDADTVTEVDKYRELVTDAGWETLLMADDSSQHKYLDNAQKLGVVFIGLLNPETDQQAKAITFVATHNMYVRTRENFLIVVSTLLHPETLLSDTFLSQPWTIMMKHSALTAVATYMRADINGFIQILFLSSDEGTPAITEVLNSRDVSTENRLSIIANMAFNLNDPAEITVNTYFSQDELTFSLQDMLFRYNRIIPGWRAILTYVNDSYSNEILSEYLIQHASELASSRYTLTDSSKDRQLYTAVFCNTGFSVDKYLQLAGALDLPYALIDNQLPPNNFLQLAKAGLLEITEEAWIHVADVFSPLNKVSADAFRLWLAETKIEITDAPDVWLRPEEPSFFFPLIENLLDHAAPSIEAATCLFLYYRENTELIDIEAMSIHPDVLIKATTDAGSDELRLKLMTLLVRRRHVDTNQLAHLTEKLNNQEFNKIFVQKSQATLQLQPARVESEFLDALQHGGFIRDYINEDDLRYRVRLPFSPMKKDKYE